VHDSLQNLKVKIFADGADKAGMLSLNSNPLIRGMTTNPTLMRKAGIKDYEAFAKDILSGVTTKPISFEVFSDDFDEMALQATTIDLEPCPPMGRPHHHFHLPWWPHHHH